MKFKIYSDNKTLQDAAALVEKHYKDKAFLDLVKAQPSFNYTNKNGQIVAFDIEDSNITMNVREYKTKWPWSNAIGYAEGNTIYVNTRKIDLPLAERVENFMHEPMHLLGYSHKGNFNTPFNKETVPYKVAAIFRMHLEDKKII